MLWFLAGIFKKRNAAAAGVVKKKTPSQRAGARLKPEPLAAGDLEAVTGGGLWLWRRRRW